MQEAKIIHPTLADGHEELKASLIREFGGVTIIEGEGCWMSDRDIPQIEQVQIYTVAVIPGDLTTQKLRAIAFQAKWAGKQKKQYLRLPNGFVELL